MVYTKYMYNISIQYNTIQYNEIYNNNNNNYNNNGKTKSCI